MKRSTLDTPWVLPEGPKQTTYRHQQYPEGIDPETVAEIEADLAKYVKSLQYELRHEFGRVPVSMMNPEILWGIMREFAVAVSRHTSDDIEGQRLADARQASANMLKGVLAGVKIGQDSKEKEEG